MRFPPKVCPELGTAQPQLALTKIVQCLNFLDNHLITHLIVQVIDELLLLKMEKIISRSRANCSGYDYIRCVSFMNSLSY